MTDSSFDQLSMDNCLSSVKGKLIKQLIQYDTTASNKAMYLTISLVTPLAEQGDAPSRRCAADELAGNRQPLCRNECAI